MKKQNYLITFLIFIMIFIVSINTYNYIAQINTSKETISKEIIDCQNNNSYEKTEYCKRILTTTIETPDFFTFFTNIFIMSFRNYIPLLFMIIAIATIAITSNYYKKNIINNFLQREKYSKYLLTIIKQTYKSVLIVIIPTIFAFIICYIYSKSFDYTYSVKYSSVVWSQELLAQPYKFIFLYLLVITLYICTYINICLIIANRITDFWKAIICAFLTFIGIELFLEIFINNILFAEILKSELGNAFNIMNIITFNDTWGLFVLVGLPIIYFLLTSLILIMLYKNKEKFLYRLSEER